MAGRIVDLSLPAGRLPSRLVLDSSLIVDWLLSTARIAETSAVPTTAQQRAGDLFARMRIERVTGFVGSTSLAEVFHFVVKARFRAELANHRSALVARYPDVRRHGWEHLFKARSDLMTQVAPGLDRVRRLMTGNRLLVLQPEDLGPIPSGRAFDDELVRTMERYQLDSNDAAILVEAGRAGISAVASSDADFRRAQLDVDVYTWV